MHRVPVLMLFVTFLVGGAFVYANTPDIFNNISSDSSVFTPFTGEIKGNRVRVRLAPHTDSSVIKELSKGDLISVIGEKQDYYIISALEGIKGYVFRTFVLDNVIEGEQVNVRLEPSTSAPVLSRLSKGTKVQLTQNQAPGKWFEIELPNQCVFYVAKNFVTNKGSIELYQQQEKQKKLALSLLEDAQVFAKNELQKDVNDIDLEAIYKKINVLQDEEFKNVPNLQFLIQKVLEEVQNIYLTKSVKQIDTKAEDKIFEVSNEEATVQIASIQTEQPIKNKKEGGSLLSRHIRKQTVVKAKPSLKGRENLEYSLFKIWASMQSHGDSNSFTQEDFYKEEQKKQQILVGELEPYSHIVKNNPGDFLLKNNEKTIAFLYATKLDLNQWVGKKVSVTCLPRPNNSFAFPAYYVLDIKEIS